MSNCIRRGEFEEQEKHECFVINCNYFCYPAIAETCQKCNFKFCEVGHCGCSVSKETRYALTVLYRTYCELCSTKGTVVLWKLNGLEVDHKPNRTPKLGWCTLTILEKFVDSAKTAWHIDNKSMTVGVSLNKAIAIIRKKISLEKMISPQTLLKTCEFRETKRTRCNRYPTRFKDNKYLCDKHFEEKKK